MLHQSRAEVVKRNAVVAVWQIIRTYQPFFVFNDLIDRHAKLNVIATAKKTSTNHRIAFKLYSEDSGVKKVEI
jgi:hypothetical protein